MLTLDILGVPHAYELTPSTGNPCVLVFIHGWLLSRGYWQPLIERLSPEYQCLSYDLRGFGESNLLPAIDTRTPFSQLSGAESGEELLQTRERTIDWGGTSQGRLSSEESFGQVTEGKPTATATLKSQRRSRYTPAAYAQDLAVLLQELQIQQAWLIGHSLGGSIALWGADAMPDLVRGTICLNSGGGIYLKEEFERFRSAGQQLLRMRPRWLCDLPLIDLLFTRASVAKTISRTWGRQRVIDFVMAHPEAAAGALLDSTTEEEVHRLPQVVSRLQQPVYFLAGEQDPIMEPKYVRHLASFHPLFRTCGDNVLDIPDCGHLAMVEQPNLVADHIRRILTTYL